MPKHIHQKTQGLSDNFAGANFTMGGAFKPMELLIRGRRIRARDKQRFHMRQGATTPDGMPHGNPPRSLDLHRRPAAAARRLDRSLP
jgi:hypothetical protein